MKKDLLRTLLLSLMLASAAMPSFAQEEYEIDFDSTRQVHEGWGVSLCWWANMCGKWSDAQINQLVDWLVSPSGLNYNIFRYNIGGGDDPNNANCTPHHMVEGKGARAEMEGFKDYSGDAYHWERDAAQRKIMLRIKAKRPDAIFEAFSNSAPYYMTKSGCTAGHKRGLLDNLDKAYYEEFAHYLVDVCKHYKDEYNIEFRTLEPFNEPYANWWTASGSQEGCHFGYISQVNFLKVLQPILEESGLSTVIAASDENSLSASVAGFEAYKVGGALPLVGQWNVHSYSGSNIDRRALNALVRRQEGMRLWMSETGNGGEGLQGNLDMAQRLVDDMRYLAPDAWCDWQYVEEDNDQWCMVKGNFAEQTCTRVKNYYVRQQYSRFIKKGYTYLETTSERVLAALSPTTDTLVVVALNNTEEPIEQVCRLVNGRHMAAKQTWRTTATLNCARQAVGDISDDGVLSYTMPAQSVTTFLIAMDDKGEENGGDEGDGTGGDTGGDDEGDDDPTEDDGPDYEVRFDSPRQVNEGWGVSLCWWANMCGKWSDTKINQLVDWLVSPSGLNYNIFRYNIGGGDDPNNANCTPHHMAEGKGLRAEMEGFKDYSDDVYHWERDAAQRKIVQRIKKRRPDAIFEAFSNSAPYYMTKSGCVAGHKIPLLDNLKTEYYEEFAHYLVDVCKHFRDEEGIEFLTLEPFNEPAFSWWGAGGGQEGCHFGYSAQVSFLKVLQPILEESGLSTIISASDENALAASIAGFEAYKVGGALPLIGQWNTHSYRGSNLERRQLNAMVRKEEGMRLWMSETGDGGEGLQGNLDMAQRLVDDMRYLAPDAWCDWQYVEEDNDQWCMVQGNFAEQTCTRVKNYYVRQQYSRFIKKGYTYLETTSERVLAALSPTTDTLVVVALNNTEEPIEQVCRLVNGRHMAAKQTWRTTATLNCARQAVGDISDDGVLSYTMPAQSVTTFLIAMDDEDLDVIDSAPLQDEALVRVTQEGGMLNVEALGQACQAKVYRADGTCVGCAPVGREALRLPLPAGVYVVSATSADGRQSQRIKVLHQGAGSK